MLQGSIYPSSTKKSFTEHFLQLTKSYNDFFPLRICLCSITKTYCWTGALSSAKLGLKKVLYLIQDLLDAHGNVMLYTILVEKYLLSCNFLTYFQVISAIPKQFIERAKVTPLERLPVNKMFSRFHQNFCVNFLK